MKQASLVKLSSGEHKFAVRIHTQEGTKTVRFGKYGASDFTIHKNRPRRLRYLDRHGRIYPGQSRSYKEDWSQKGLYTAGYWSRWLLWEKPSMKKAIEFMRNQKNINIIER